MQTSPNNSLHILFTPVVRSAVAKTLLAVTVYSPITEKHHMFGKMVGARVDKI